MSVKEEKLQRHLLAELIYCCKTVWRVVAVALEACDSDNTVENHSVQLYSPVTFANQTTSQTAQSNCFLNSFNQFCTVCIILYLLTDCHT